MEISVEELNELLQKEFERGTKLLTEFERHPENNRYDYTMNVCYENNACVNCLNNPKNGGSGICNCILGTQLYYTTSDNIK